MMSARPSKFFLILLLLVGSSLILPSVTWGQSRPGSLSTVRNPRTFHLNNSSLSIKARAFSCLAVTELPDDIPCQPALVRLEKKPRFAANGYISNGYQSLSKARRILSGDLDAELMNSLFAEDQILEVETSASMYFTSSYLAGKYVPYGLQFYSTQRNQANPELEVFAAESKQFVFQTGLNLTRSILLGLQVRSQQNKIVDRAFRLVDLGTDSGKELLKPKESSHFYVEPGAAWVSDAWKFSVLGAGLAVGGSEEDPVRSLNRPELQLGASYEARISSSIVDWSLDIRGLDETVEKDEHKIHGGVRLRYGALSLLGGLDAYGLSGGMLFSIEKVYSGIVYSTSQVPWRVSDEFVQTVYIELGWQL